ncbi:MAG: hypothetical protein E7118_06330 [Bacteroidales bacterium]|nr:hypothetical protein [Bacteroidales bacterium]
MKLTKYFLSMAAAVAMIASCDQPEMVQISAPEDVVAPVLDAVEGPIEITPSNLGLEKVTFAWTPADYGVKTQVSYSIEAAVAATPDSKVTVMSGITDTTTVTTHILAEVTYEALNAILYNDLKLADGVSEDVVFSIGAKVGEYAKIYSNAVTVSCKVTAAEKEYPKLTVAGSYAYNNWTPGKGQFVFDFEGTDAKYSGVIDFGEDVSALQFKFVGTAWGQNEFSVPAGEAQAPEAAELPLVAGGGDNISAYTTHRYYSLTLDKGTPKVTKNFSFNQIGVIGSFNEWGGDVVMNFNAEKQRFYADVEFAADGQFKLRADADWALNWGADAFGMTVSNTDGNLEAKAGQYRVYVNMNNPAAMTIELNAGMFGKEEPVGGTTTPEPEPEPTPTVQGWGLVGEYNSWGGTPDVMLASDGTYLVAKGVELSGQVKFRKDGDWAVNFGAPGEVEPVEITVNTELELVAGGKNFTIAEGTYDVYLDETNAKAWFINDGSYPGGGAALEMSEWGLIGSLAACNNWGVNIPLYISGDYAVAKGVAFAAGDQFKFRKGETWGVELTYEGQITIDAKLDLIDGTGGKQNSSIADAGTYDVYLANDLSAFYVMTPGKTPADAGEAVVTYTDASAVVVGFSGSFAGEDKWTDPADDRLATFVSKNVTDPATYSGTYTYEVASLAIAENDAFKVRINGKWIGVGEAAVEGLTVTGTGDFIAGEAGTYKVVITFAWDGLTHSDVKVVFSK